MIDFVEGRYGSDAGAVTGPDGAAGPERGLTITRAREIAVRLSELTAALEVRSPAHEEFDWFGHGFVSQ